MAQALALEKVNKNGNPEKHYLVATSRKPWKAKKLRLDTGVTVELDSSDEGDHNFKSPDISMSDSKSYSDSGDLPLSNTKVYAIHQSIP